MCIDKKNKQYTLVSSKVQMNERDNFSGVQVRKVGVGVLSSLATVI